MKTIKEKREWNEDIPARTERGSKDLELRESKASCGTATRSYWQPRCRAEVQGEGTREQRPSAKALEAAMGSRDFQVTGGLTMLLATNPVKTFERVS